jgi:hypothetical protein
MNGKTFVDTNILIYAHDIVLGLDRVQNTPFGPFQGPRTVT